MQIRKHDNCEPDESHWSAGTFYDEIALMVSRPLQYTILFVLTLFIIAAVGVLATRSIWIDEAMLLKNVYELDVIDFLHPLPYYEQASPLIPLVVIKLISEIAGTNFVIFRILTFAFILICATPLLLKLKQMYSLNGLLSFLLVCAANVYNLLFYATEIKHYGFEAAGVFLFLYWFLCYLEDSEKAFALRRIWIALLAIAMGFSTLLLVPSFFLFVVIHSIYQHKIDRRLYLKSVLKHHGRLFVMMAMTSLVVYAFMSYLTMFQMGQGIYKIHSFMSDSRIILSSSKGAFSKIYNLSIVLVLFSFFVNFQSNMFKLSLFFTSTAAIVMILKFFGLYPVIYARHLIWLIPIGMTIIALYICVMVARKEILGLFLIIYTTFLVIDEAIDVVKKFEGELTANNALYAALADIPPADILVLGDARPSLEIYRMKSSALSKHRYFGLMPGGDLSIRKDSPDIAFAGGGLKNQ